jgi:transposase
MVDIPTNRIVDMIETRDYEPIKEWLESYPNLEVVSRDGSITYKNAIEAAHPTATQISDRFHLLKNLTKYAMEYLKKKLKVRIVIPAGDENESSERVPAVLPKANENRKLTAAEKYDKIKELSRLGYTKTQICREINMDLRFYEKLIVMTPAEREVLFKTNLDIVHEEKVEQKMRRVNEVRDLKAAGFSIRAIARRTKLNHRTVAKYIKADFTPVHTAYGQKKGSILTPYMQEIDSMIAAGMMGTDITRKITDKGYTGSASTVRHYIADWKKRRKHSYEKSSSANGRTEIIERNDVFKLLFHPLEKVKSISSNTFERFCCEYPCFQRIHNIVWEFRHLLTAKIPDSLASWLKKAQALKIREINSFVDGMKRDYEAVLNAVKFDYSNGLAEGKVNKLKLVKRIMYGRCHFSTLKSKLLLIENPSFFN